MIDVSSLERVLALCHKNNQKIDFQTILELQADFNESDLPYNVDLIDMNVYECY